MADLCGSCSHSLVTPDLTRLDLIKLGQKEQALESLSVVAARRNRTWEKALESVVIRFLDLCVETGKVPSPSMSPVCLGLNRFRAEELRMSFTSTAIRLPNSLSLSKLSFATLSRSLKQRLSAPSRHFRFNWRSWPPCGVNWCMCAFVSSQVLPSSVRLISTSL